jgi:hypothetical protein
MALADRIDINVAGLTQEKINQLLKGIAIGLGKYSTDGNTLDISNPGLLVTTWKQLTANQLISLAIEAQKFELSKAAPSIEIN